MILNSEEELTVVDFCLAGIILGVLLIYLVYALLKPEEF